MVPCCVVCFAAVEDLPQSKGKQSQMSNSIVVNYADDAYALPVFLTGRQITEGGQTLLLMLLSISASFLLYCSLMALYKRSPQNIANDRAESERFINNVCDPFVSSCAQSFTDLHTTYDH